ncbi:MAG: Rpn family recombination-promoting nuclease/putative transposase [Bacteroidales bacterium]|nr:Rpn family recombination-promoting nuclease/putative transposase [Bacteroidales bacterium]
MLLRDLMQMDLKVEKPLSNEIDRFQPDDRNIIMDVVCQLRDGRRIIVEMQQEKKALAIARRMLEDNEPIEKIVKYSGLTEEQVRDL